MAAVSGRARLSQVRLTILKQVNVHAAKTHLSRLLDDVESGEEVVIARSGRPVARLIRFRPETPARIPGLLKGRIRIAADFDALDPELAHAFEGADDPAATRESGFRTLSIEPEDGLVAGHLPQHHGDPYDRMLVAQALRRGMQIVTGDPWFDRYGVPVIRV